MRAFGQPDPHPAEAAASPDAQDLLPAVRRTADTLLEQLQALRQTQPQTTPMRWAEHIAAAQELVAFLNSEGTAPPAGPRRGLPMTAGQQREFGRLLRDRRNQAGFSRLQLARKAQLSDATIKFIETARHPPSRTSLLRLIEVPALRLGWADVPGQHAPPATSLAAQAGPLQGVATAGDLLLVLDRIDFDELGDPVFVRLMTVPGPDVAHGPPLPRPNGSAVCALIPVRR